MRGTRSGNGRGLNFGDFGGGEIGDVEEGASNSIPPITLAFFFKKMLTFLMDLARKSMGKCF